MQVYLRQQVLPRRQRLLRPRYPAATRGPLPLLFLDRYRYQAPPEGLYPTMKPDPFLIQEEVLSSNMEHWQSRFFGLPGILAPLFPYLVREIVVCGPPGRDNELVEIGYEMSCKECIISGEFVKDSDLALRQFLSASLPVSLS